MNAIDPTPSSKRTFNVAAACIGFIFFVFGMWLLMKPGLGSTVDYRLIDFIICAGFGLLLYAIGDEAQIVGKNYNIVGASGITIIIFYIFASNDIGKPEAHQTHAKLEISAAESSDPEIFGSQNPNTPAESLIVYRGGIMNGITIKQNPYFYTIDFSLSDADILDMQSTDCPLLVVKLRNGNERRKSFLAREVMSRDNRYFFDFVLKIDKDKLKDRLFARSGQAPHPTHDCETSQGRELAAVTAQSNADRDISKSPTVSNSAPLVIKKDALLPTATVPAVSNTIATPPVVQMEQVAPTPPTEAAIDPPVSKLLGYVVVSQLADETGQLEKTWFEIEGKHDTLVPIQNDVVVLTAEKATLRLEPYHWDIEQKKHVLGEPTASIVKGQKLRIGGDCLIVKDETNRNSWYVIAPISEIIGTKIQNEAVAYPPFDLPGGVKGYVYIGYLDRTGASLSDKSFDNFSSPDAIYPSPNDVLLAKSDIWLREGPRRWDVDKRLYTKPPAVTAIHKGDYVAVAGDISLAKGISLWIPISKKAPFPKGVAPQKTFLDKFRDVFKSP